MVISHRSIKPYKTGFFIHVSGEPGSCAGADGRTYYIPADMTYKKWQKSFVEGGKPGLKGSGPDGKMNSTDITYSKVESLLTEV